MPSDFPFDQVFQVEFDKAIEAERLSSGFEPDTWDAAGRHNDQGEDFWRLNGPQYALNFINWYESQEDVKVWVTPDGRPAIELDLTADFRGIPVRVVVDAVLAFGAVNPALVVVDLKSGSTRPDSARQLAIGASAIELAYGIRPRYGAFFMARRGQLEPPSELGRPQHSVSYLANEFLMLELATAQGIYPAKPGDHCRRCPVAYACTEAGGAQAHLYDPHSPAYRPGSNRGR